MTEITAVFQNIDGDGLPTLLGDVVGTCEAPYDKRRLKRRLRGRTHFFPKKNYRMTASWFEEKTPLIRRRRIKVHASSKRPPTPRRDIIVLTLAVGPNGVPVSFIFGHAVNSAWAPKDIPTSFRRERMELWLEWADMMTEVIRRELNKGRHVVVMADANKSRPPNWSFPVDKLRVVWHHGPDRVWVSQGIKMLKSEEGPKTGNGRVTHPSVRVTLEIPDKEQS